MVLDEETASDFRIVYENDEADEKRALQLLTTEQVRAIKVH